MNNRTPFLARGLALLWAAFWLLFFVVESLAWHTPVAVMAVWTGAGLFFLLLAAIAWRSEFKGGLLLGGVGVLAGLAYTVWSPVGLPPVSRLLTATALGVPPILAGMLFLLHYRAVSAGAHTAPPTDRTGLSAPIPPAAVRESKTRSRKTLRPR